jgi:glycosyltransferase involved in cell wall biosynthesis
VYLTYPFVLSWSLLEAMACGCVVVGSRTPPVEEVIRHEDNGLLVDFFDAQKIAAAVDDALARQAELAPLRQRARDSVVAGYDLKRVCLPGQLRMIESLLRDR